jgi:ketosteroid isomerase-like protein
MVRKWLAGSLLLLLSVTACKQSVQIAVTDKAADEAAIRHVLDEIVSTFNAGNYDGMFAQYSDDVVVSSPGQPDIVGKEAWRAGLGALPEGAVMKMRFDTQELELSGDLAFERGTFLLEAQDAKTSQFVPMIKARHVHIFRRDADGNWKGWRLMENSSDPATALLQPPPAPPPKE